MSTTVNDIITGIKGRITTVFGSGYVNAPYGVDFLKNSQKNSGKIYSVLPGTISNVQTVTRSVTYDQEFNIMIGDTYINKSMSDDLQQTAAITLIELAKNLFKDVLDSKCGVPSICLNTTQLQVEEPVHVPESKLVIIEMSFIVKYRELL